MEGRPGCPAPSHSCTPSFLFCFFLRLTYHHPVEQWLVGVPSNCLAEYSKEGRPRSESPRKKQLVGAGNVRSGSHGPHFFLGPLFNPSEGLARGWWACLLIPQGPSLQGGNSARLGYIQKTGLTFSLGQSLLRLTWGRGEPGICGGHPSLVCSDCLTF